MGNTRTAPHNVAEYYLTSIRLGRKLIIEPDGWRTDFMQMKRSKDNTGLVNSVSLDLKFIGNGADYIRTLIDNFGTEEECILEKYTLHPTDRKLERTYRAYLKLDKYKDKDNGVTCKAEESGILSLINTYKGEKIELDRLTSLNDNVLDPLNIKKVAVSGKEISLVTEFEKNKSNPTFYAPPVGFDYYNLTAPPFDLVTSSDIQAHTVTDFIVPRSGSIPFGDGTTGNMFYADNDKLKDLKFTFDVDFEYSSSGELYFGIAEYNGGSLYNFVTWHNLAVGVSGSNKLQYQGSITFEDIPIGTSYALVHWVNTAISISYTYNKLNLTITEDSYHPATSNNVLLPYERFERILQIITGRTDDALFYSECLGRIDRGYTNNGEFAFIGSSSGFWARNFDDKPFSTTWDDTLKSYFAIRGLGFGVIKRGEQETIIIEPIEFFYQDGPIFDFPFPAANVERSIADEFQYSSIDIGFSKGGEDYEEAMGLDEPNGKHNYTGPFKASQKKFEAISKDRGDMTGYEFARRKPRSIFPTEDTRYDDDNFLMQLKEVNGFLEQILWADVYEEAPKNLYSPETHTNPSLSPKRNLLYHTFWLNGGMQKFSTQSIKNTGSTGNSNMITKEFAQAEISEKGELRISNFDPAKFQTRWLKFEHKVSASFSKILNGYTTINGRLIPNVYFRFRFVNEKGDYELCRIWEADPKDQGNFKVLKV